MKLVAGMIVSSDASFLRYSLPAIRPYVDHVIIVEGCDSRWIRMGNANPDGSSSDDTAAVIMAEAARVDPRLAPITYVEPVVYAHRNAQRQCCFDEMRRAGADVCLLVDADEFYHPEAFGLIRAEFSSRETICAIWPFFNFYTFGRRLQNDGAMERCFRMQDGMSYPDSEAGQYLLTKDGEKIWSTTTRVEGIACYHYNRVYEPERLLRKLRFYYERDFGLENGKAIPYWMFPQDDITALLKSPEAGVLVQLAEQPPFARLLAFTNIAPTTAVLSLADIMGIWPPVDVDRDIGLYPQSLTVDGCDLNVGKLLGLSCDPAASATTSILELLATGGRSCDTAGATCVSSRMSEPILG